MPDNLHPIQGNILKELLFHPDRKFSELAPKGVSSDQLSFHVKRLAELNLIRKVDDRYELTTSGKEFANRFDTETITIERQAKIGVRVVCVRLRGKEQEYLIEQRLKQPYYGFYGFTGGKARWGETIFETAERELKEETGLTATLLNVGIIHKLDYSPQNELLEDKFFFLFRGENPQGKVLESFEGGRNAWFTKDEIVKLPDLFPDVLEVLGLVDQKTFQLIERKYTVEKY